MPDSTNACILGIVSSLTRKQAADFLGKFELQIWTRYGILIICGQLAQW